MAALPILTGVSMTGTPQCTLYDLDETAIVDDPTLADQLGEMEIETFEEQRYKELHPGTVVSIRNKDLQHADHRALPSIASANFVDWIINDAHFQQPTQGTAFVRGTIRTFAKKRFAIPYVSERADYIKLEVDTTHHISKEALPPMASIAASHMSAFVFTGNSKYEPGQRVAILGERLLAASPANEDTYEPRPYGVANHSFTKDIFPHLQHDETNTTHVLLASVVQFTEAPNQGGLKLANILKSDQLVVRLADSSLRYIIAINPGYFAVVLPD